MKRKHQTRTELLEAARGVIRRKGFAATTARDVAAEAGVSVGTVFVHFPTMAALAETILDETVGAALAVAADTLPPAGLVERLVHVSGTLYDAYDAERELSRQVLSASLFESAPGSPSDRRMAEFRGWVVAEVDAAVAAGEIPAVDGGEAFLGFFALYLGGLVAGLRGELDRPAQLALMQSSLRRLLGATEKE